MESKILAGLIAMGILKDLFNLMRERKKWWLLPVAAALLLLGFLLLFSGGSAVAPLVYTVF